MLEEVVLTAIGVNLKIMSFVKQSKFNLKIY